MLLSFLGSLPPGLISLSVAREATLRGFGAAMVLAFGAALAEFFQAWVAAAGAGWLAAHPAVEQALRWAAGPVFAGVALYLWFWARPPQPKPLALSNSAFRRFYQGVLVSAFNLLAIPYWVVYATWLQVNGWWHPGATSYLFFALGVVLGTLGALAVYARLGDTLHRKGNLAYGTINRAVALIFAGLALLTFLQAAQG